MVNAALTMVKKTGLGWSVLYALRRSIASVLVQDDCRRPAVWTHFEAHLRVHDLPEELRTAFRKDLCDPLPGDLGVQPVAVAGDGHEHRGGELIAAGIGRKRLGVERDRGALHVGAWGRRQRRSAEDMEPDVVPAGDGRGVGQHHNPDPRLRIEAHEAAVTASAAVVPDDLAG